ncbi:MAG: TonB-dependent receptor [Paludibacteraceae bacterium]|nr:TonB-dependent receptor [Paludibacteraceae bacterium]
MKSKTFSFFRGLFVSALMLCSVAAFSQTVTGVVTDAANGEPVIGASVLVMGTTTGTITDFDGNFSINAASDAVLQISYMGYKTQEIPVAGQKVIRVQMAEDAELLDEVVVVGYGVVKKNDATGSVTAIKPDDMNKGLTTNATDMLSGKIAGVAVTSNDGTPGGGATIRIRGGSSLAASNDPLIVIDGLAMDNDGVKGVANPLSMVNPADIESFTVLKDASATAIYGSRASNGVIIITTKKGSANQKLKVSYNGNVSIGTLLNTMEVMNGDELRAYAGELYGNKAKYPDTYRPKVLNYLGTANTDWQREIYRTAISTDHNISLMGGTKNMPYRFSLGYTDQNGVIKTSNMQRVTASLNLNPSFLDKHLVFNLNAKGMYIYNRYAPGVVGSAISYDPTVPVMGEARNAKNELVGVGNDVLDQIFGGYFGRVQSATLNDSEWNYQFNTQTASNPANVLRYTNDRAHSGSFVGNLEADYKIHGFEDLRIHANFGADYSYGKQTTSIDRLIQSTGNGYYGYEGYEYAHKYNLSFSAYAQYYKDFSDMQHFDIMVGGEYQKFHRTSYREGSGFYPETNLDPSLRGTKKDYTYYDYGTQSALLSFFGRANWVGWNQVMATVTLRADASTRFAPDVRWGLFPSVALGWKIKETFFQDVNWLNDLKLRLGYGITGQQNLGQGDFQYLAVYVQNQAGAWSTLGETTAEANLTGKVEGTDYVVGDDGYVYYKTYRPNEYNPGLTWEKTTTYNAGIDFAFLNNRISGSLDYYYRLTKDLINAVDIPAGSNFKTRVIKNVGSLYNTGLEFAINAVAIDRKNFKWELGYNVTWNKNRILNLTGSDEPGYFEYNTGSGIGNGQYTQANTEGQAANSFYVYESKTNPNTGLLYMVDQDHPDALPGDADYDLTTSDKIFYHNPAAPVMMGFNTKFQFYGVDLGITFRSNIGNYVYNSVLQDQLQYVVTAYDAKFDGYHSILKEAYNSYYDDGCRLRNETDGVLTTYFVQRASFLRCDNITLGYSFAPKNVNLNGRVYCTVSNPFVISPYKGLDPEIAGGIDSNMYPRCMSTVIGLSLNF